MDGQTVLHVACEQGEVGIVELLVKFKIKPKWKPNKLRTRKSSRKSNPSNASLSEDEVYYPLKVNAVNNARVMPLHIAIKNGFGHDGKFIISGRTILQQYR
jgi:ankyrin repeat protein